LEAEKSRIYVSRELHEKMSEVVTFVLDASSFELLRQSVVTLTDVPQSIYADLVEGTSESIFWTHNPNIASGGNASVYLLYQGNLLISWSQKFHF